MGAAYTAVAESPVVIKEEPMEVPAAPIKPVKKPKRKAEKFDQPPMKIPNIKVELEQEDNWSAKIGYERYIYMVRGASGVRIFMGEALANPGVSALSGKNIELNVYQFLTLYGLFLSGKAECVERKASTKESGSLAPLLDLSNDVYFTWNRFQSSDLATIRLFVKKGKSNDMYPTKTGFSFGEKVFNNILELFKTMVSEYFIKNENFILT